jgi:RimJ/RimL family protein N-acetyltransferase
MSWSVRDAQVVLYQHDPGGGVSRMIMPRMNVTQDDRGGGQVLSSEKNVPELHLTTRRLALRALTYDDLDALASMLGDAAALAYWGSPLTRNESRSWIERNLRRYEDDGFGRCAIVLRTTGELVGDCGLIATLVEGRPEVELGWIVRRGYQGKGIATEAAAAWRDYAFDTIGLERIVSMVSEKNVASRRVAEKLGMTVEREALWDGLPHLMYSMCPNQREVLAGS